MSQVFFDSASPQCRQWKETHRSHRLQVRVSGQLAQSVYNKRRKVLKYPCVQARNEMGSWTRMETGADLRGIEVLKEK